MRYKSSIHSKALGIKSVMGRMMLPFKNLKYSSDELIVVNYHSTPKKFISDFEMQVLFLKNHFDILDPADLENYFAGKLKSKKCSLLFTFDDGLKNNLYAANILSKHNIRAFYFLVPQFIETPVLEQKAYYLKNIRPIVNTNVDSEPEDFEALNWDDIEELVKDGNRIGSHTFTHTMTADDAKNSERQIIESKSFLETKLNRQINSFCSINNTLLSVGKTQKQLLEKTYSFHFTTLPGYNSVNKNPKFIKRRNIECFWPDGAVYFALGKSDLSRWVERIKQYENL